MKKVIILLGLIITIIIAVLFYKFYNIEKSYKERGYLLIDKIENYKDDFGALPNSVYDLNIEEEMGQGPYYEKVDTLNYKVYFNIGFDTSLIYYSKSNTWEEYP